MAHNYRYFASYDGEQVVVDKSEHPDVSWYEHKGAREVKIVDVDAEVIPVDALPEVTYDSEVALWVLADGRTYYFPEADSVTSALLALTAIRRAMQAQESEEKAQREDENARINYEVLLQHIQGHLTTVGDLDNLSTSLAKAGYKITKED